MPESTGGVTAPGGLALQPNRNQAVPLGGAAGNVMDVVLCTAPVVFLLVVTLSKRLFLPTTRSLPYAAAMLWLVKMAYIGEDPIHITATIMQGALLALVPLSILFGAFFFFNVLNVTQTMPYIAALVRATCCNHPVSEVFLIMWAMGHLIEGASGFGTGPAMLPPILAAMGHAPFESICCLLIMTSTVGPFGSSGIGLWFGLQALEWSRVKLVEVTFLVAICTTLLSYPIAIIGSRLLLSWEDLRSCWVFVVLSTTACAVPALLAALFSFEAPGLLSGVLGVVFTGLLARHQLGLSQEAPCLVARRLKELESGAAAAIGDDGEGRRHTSPGQEQAAGEEAAATLVQKRAASAKPLGVARDTIELVTVAASYPAAAQRPLALGQRQSTEECTGAAQGLLKALAASSPTSARASHRQARSAPSHVRFSDVDLASPGGPGSDSLSPSNSGSSGDGELELLPARSVLSHQNMGSSYGAQRDPASVPQSYQQQGHQPGAGSSSSIDGAALAYLSDRRQLVLRLLPWAAMLLVVAGTRVPYLQKSNGHELHLHLRSLGDFHISGNAVLQFKDLCRIGVNWSYAVLYVPSFLPFICTGCATLFAFRHSIPLERSWRHPFAAAAAKCKGVAPAITGALILVALTVQGGRQAPAYIIGYWLSEWLQRGYIAASMLLGAVGSFFSGSVATSNMTFGMLQQVAAQKLGLEPTAMVMLQIVGGAAGQMIAISNILGGRAVMDLQHIPEGEFVKRCLPACLAYYVVGTALALPFLFS